MNAIRILIVDDHEVVRAGISALLARESDLLVVGEASTAEEALLMLDSRTPDVILLDYRLPGLSGAMACSEIVGRRPSAAVLILTSCDEDGVLMSCLAAGARGYLLKDADCGDLVAGIRAVASGRCVVAPGILDSLFRLVRDTTDLHHDESRLSPDEVAALSLAARGQKNREIARALKVTEGAVKAYLTGARKKLGANERSEAVLAGIRRGVI